MSETKIARKVSSDSSQERLRQHKADWNAATSELIAEINEFKSHLISLKRGINGRGDPKAGLPISNIKNPLPPEIKSYLSGVASEFQGLNSAFGSLVGGANSIISEQNQYAQTRRKSSKEQRQASDDSDMLIVEGSTPISRLWAQLSSFLSSDAAKQQRLSMLSEAHKLFRKLIDLEDETLTKGVDNIAQVLNEYFLVSNNFQILKMMGQKFEQSLKAPSEEEEPKSTTKPQAPQKPQTATKSKDKPEEPEEVEKVEKVEKPIVSVDLASPSEAEHLTADELKAEVIKMTHMGFSMDDIRPFLDIYHARRKEKNENKQAIMLDRMQTIYNELFTKLRQKSAFMTDIELVKNASSYLSRLLKKYRQEYGFKEPTSAVRMEMYGYIRDAKIQVDQIMDMLESKNIDAQELNKKIAEVEKLIVKMGEPVKILNMMHKQKYYSGTPSHKTTIDPIEQYYKRQIRQDIGKPPR